MRFICFVTSHAIRFICKKVAVPWLYLPAPSEACRPEQATMIVTKRTKARHAEGAMARTRLGQWRYCERLYLSPTPTGGGASPTWPHVGGAVTSRYAVNKIYDLNNKKVLSFWLHSSFSSTVTAAGVHFDPRTVSFGLAM